MEAGGEGSGGGKGVEADKKTKTKDDLMNIYDVVCVTTMTNKRDSAIHGQRYCLLIWKWPNIIKGGSIKASVIWWYEFQIPGDQGIPHIAAFNMGAGRRRRLTDMKRCEKMEAAWQWRIQMRKEEEVIESMLHKNISVLKEDNKVTVYC